MIFRFDNLAASQLGLAGSYSSNSGRSAPAPVWMSRGVTRFIRGRPASRRPPRNPPPAARNLREHGDGVPHADEVVGAEGPPHGRSAQVLVLVFAQSGDGLRGQAEGTEATAE